MMLANRFRFRLLPSSGHARPASFALARAWSSSARSNGDDKNGLRSTEIRARVGRRSNGDNQQESFRHGNGNGKGRARTKENQGAGNRGSIWSNSSSELSSQLAWLQSLHRSVLMSSRMFIGGCLVITVGAGYVIVNWAMVRTKVSRESAQVISNTIKEEQFQFTAKEFSTELIHQILNDGEIAATAAVWIMRLLTNIQDEIGSLFVKILAQEQVIQAVNRLADRLVEYLCASTFIQEQVGRLLVDAICLQYTRDQAAQWAYDLVMREDVICGFRDLVVAALQMDTVVSEAQSLSVQVVNQVLQDPETLAEARRVITDTLRDSELQATAKESLWGMVVPWTSGKPVSETKKMLRSIDELLASDFVTNDEREVLRTVKSRVRSGDHIRQLQIAVAGGKADPDAPATQPTSEHPDHDAPATQPTSEHTQEEVRTTTEHVVHTPIPTTPAASMTADASAVVEASRSDSAPVPIPTGESAEPSGKAATSTVSTPQTGPDVSVTTSSEVAESKNTATAEVSYWRSAGQTLLSYIMPWSSQDSNASKTTTPPANTESKATEDNTVISGQTGQEPPDMKEPVSSEPAPMEGNLDHLQDLAPNKIDEQAEGTTPKEFAENAASTNPGSNGAAETGHDLSSTTQWQADAAPVHAAKDFELMREPAAPGRTTTPNSADVEQKAMDDKETIPEQVVPANMKGKDGVLQTVDDIKIDDDNQFPEQAATSQPVLVKKKDGGSQTVDDIKIDDNKKFPEKAVISQPVLVTKKDGGSQDTSPQKHSEPTLSPNFDEESTSAASQGVHCEAKSKPT